MTKKSFDKDVAREMQAVVSDRYGYTPGYQRCLTIHQAAPRVEGESVDARAKRLVDQNKFDPKDA